jgi:hypothetical protein
MRGHDFRPDKVNPADGNHDTRYGKPAVSKYDDNHPDNTNSKHPVGNDNDDNAA